MIILEVITLGSYFPFYNNWVHKSALWRCTTLLWVSYYTDKRRLLSREVDRRRAESSSTVINPLYFMNISVDGIHKLIANIAKKQFKVQSFLLQSTGTKEWK